MARYLTTVWPFAGHLNPTLAVAHALRARGHAVGIYSGEAVRSVIEDEGFTFFPFDHLAATLLKLVDGVHPGSSACDDGAFYRRLIARYGDAYERSGVERARLLKRMSYEWILGTVPQQIADLDMVIDHWRPDVVLCDPTLWGPYVVLGEARRLPVAVFSFFAGCMIPGPDAPPAGMGLPPPRNWRTRALSRLAARVLDIYMADVRHATSDLRQRYGLPRLRDSVASMSGRVPLHLVATAPEYDYDRGDLPSAVHYVGACLWDKARHEAPPPWLRGLPDDRPIVYVSEGTAQVDESVEPALLSAAARGLAGLPMRVIITTGRHRDPQTLELGTFGSNIRVERYVPHSDLFPRLSAVVTNGGSGTVRAALAAGLPLVVVPRAWDQFDNAQRVVEAGAGIRLTARRCTPERLRAAVQQVLQIPSFRDNARRLGAASARCGGPDRAAALLEELVRRQEAMPACATAGGR